ncbi:MAG TPA: glycosyltransferase family 2 protein [Paenibacillus sp.]|uniref:glycosyltransferase family 2 protein n=1 Tax=Paenibacillus sp. TaxID=58172 RepID=UPI002C45359C|nr:glycosyltransferase family 2 protein [Paenibacillus sp.]HUC92011.1 glycosyltransferase family 2 protein [Paenibacillus sp.]
MYTPKFSIITPTYNSEKYLQQTIESVKYQTYPHVEHVIVDGKSTDGTMEIVSNHAAPQSVIISEPDAGTSDAINKGIRAATGDIILFLGSDDYLYAETVLEEIAEVFARDPELSIAHGNILMIDPNSGYFLVNGKKTGLEELKRGDMCPFPAFFAKKSLYEQCGLLDLSYVYANDFDLVIKCFLTEGVKIQYVDKLCTVFRLGGVSSNIKTENLSRKVTSQVINKHFGIDVDLSLSAMAVNLDYYRLWIENLLIQGHPLTYRLPDLGIKQAAIFGSVKTAIYLHADLMKSGVQVKCFIDNDARRQSFMLKDLPIYSTEWLQENQEDIDAVLVSVEGEHAQTIADNLREVLRGDVHIYTWKQLFNL